jgi:hypothetical protein
MSANLSPGGQITRSEILSRAQTWLNPPVPYSMDVYKDGYRTDCSGYVSMSWHLPSNGWTGDLDQVGVSEGYNDLKPGDMLLYHNSADPVTGSHVVLFDRWTGAVGGDFYIYEQSPPSTKHRLWSQAGYSRSLYKPYRYVNVRDDAPPTPLPGGRSAVHGDFLSVFTVNTSNSHLQESFLRMSTGQWATQDLSAAIGVPASVSQPVAVLHGDWLSVFTVNAANSHLQESYLSLSGSVWYTHDLSAAFGTPAVSGTPAATVHGAWLSVYTVNAANSHLQETFLALGGTQWSTHDMNGVAGTPSVTGSPATVVHGNWISVYTVNAANNHLDETFLALDSSTWYTQDLAATAGTPAVAGTPFAVVHGNWLSVYTVNALTGHLQETFLPLGGTQWSMQDLSSVAGVPAVTGSPAAAVHGNWLSVYTVNASNNHLQESFLALDGGTWYTQDLSATAGTPAVAGSPSAVLHGNWVSVYTVTAANNHLQETFLPLGGATWYTQDMATAVGTPPTRF